EDDIHARALPPAQVVGRPDVHVHVGCNHPADARVHLERPLLATPDVVDELPEPRTEVEHGRLRGHVALEEVGAQDAPERLLRRALGTAKARVVETRVVHRSVPARAPGATTADSAAASASA